MYGPGQNPKSILAQLDRHIQDGSLEFNMSKGDQQRDYLPVQKVAEIICRLALRPTGAGIVNCGSGKPITIKSLVETHLKKHDAQIKLNLGHYDYPDYEPMHFWADTTKLKTLLDGSIEL